ncbi:hypothetical protein K2173_022319 [Erythroxylum novogranatense]|uniref:Condensin complex subunit 1 C-terminal domain-containing protein n=1 Tax=Erythroxylum novogranatense TaxID=1862640 RepID=A0AAV8TJS3_9ROSI|nr:hypothetical protein K2173_022319 [Erythroxylum novogranatense]
MEDTLSRVIADLEDGQSSHSPPETAVLSRSTLEDLLSILDDSDPDLVDRIFAKLLSHSSLLAPITATMDGGPANTSLLASTAYLSLFLSPNSPVFTLFTPISFLSLLRSLRRAPKSGIPRDRGDSSTSSQRRVNARKRKGRVVKSKVCASGDDLGNLESEGFDVRMFFNVLEKLGMVLDLVHLNRFPDCLKSLVHTVVDIPVAIDLNGNARSFGRLVELCSRILCQLFKAEHGDEGETAAEVLKSLTPLILGVKSQARSFALEFVKSLVTDACKRNNSVKQAVVKLPRYLAQKAPEKAEARGLAVEAIMEVLRVFEFEDQVGFVEYAVKMTQGKTNLRLLGVDLILNSMMVLADPFGVDTDSEMNDSWGYRCLEALIQRCSDSNAGIRARALSNLAQLVGFFSSDEKSREVLKELMGFGEGCREKLESGMNDLLRKRCMDEKANVRRSALLLVSKQTALLGGNFDGIVLKTMGMACSDSLVSIRKAAMSALSEAFRTHSDESVTIEWLHSVPCLITDNESSIQEECENLFLDLVLDRISRAGSANTPQKGSALSHTNVKSKDVEKELQLNFSEGILIILREICNGEVMPWVKKICTSLGKKKQLKTKIAGALQNIIRKSESIWLDHSLPLDKWTAPPGAWFLLSEVSNYLPKAIDWEFLHHHWQLLDRHGVTNGLNSPTAADLFEGVQGIESNSVAWAGDRVFLLQTISNVSVELPPKSAADLAHNLLKRIEEFNMHSTEVNAHVKALRTLCKRKASTSTEADALVVKWVQQVLSKAYRILEKYISGQSEEKGENNFFTPPRSNSRRGKRTATNIRLLSEAVTAIYTIGSVVIICPSADISAIIPLLHTIITSGDFDTKLSRFPGPKIALLETAPSLYIQAWLTMGKICLADAKRAKSYIPLFIKELERSDCAALRNNLVVMLADFCVRYTALVDCYISKITKCLRDPCELVRRQTFILLSRLLQRDYVKWRGVLFLRFLLSLVDDSENIRQLSDYLFGKILKVKAPLLAYNSFVEAVFVLNDCNAHIGHSASKSSRSENRLFSIRGNDENSRAKRMHIYVSLLKQMAPEHLLATFAKLCAEILAAASDGMLNIDDVTGQAVLQDTFQVLACKEIRIQYFRGSQADTGDLEEESGDGTTAAKGRAITQAVRKGIIQNTIPIFIELKRLLESKNSPLIGCLMECLRILLKDYKNEIDEILVADKQLQKELEYDMHKYETAKAKSTAAAAVANQQNSASFLSPGAPETGNGKPAPHNLPENLQTDSRLVSAIADVAAAAKVRSVLREVNGGRSTPPLSALSVPKLKTSQTGIGARTDRPLDVLESLRRRQSFEDEN